jgi:hypothetical protein
LVIITLASRLPVVMTIGLTTTQST